MGVIHMGVNLITASVEVRSIAQQVDDVAGLSDQLFWQESTTSFVTAAARTFAQRSYAITEQLPLGDFSFQYYGNTPGVDLSYTGKLAIGFFDIVASVPNSLLFTEVKYFQAGEEVSLTIADDRTNTPIHKSFTFMMSRRTDGSVGADNHVNVTDVDVVPFAFDCSLFLADNEVVSTISNIATSPSGALVVTKATGGGIRDQQVILTTDGNQVAGVTYDVSCNILTSNSSTFQLNGKIVTKATP